jgi:hypothetical protein
MKHGIRNVSRKKERKKKGNGPRETWLFVALTKPKVPVKFSSDVEFEALWAVKVPCMTSALRVLLMTPSAL